MWWKIRASLATPTPPEQGLSIDVERASVFASWRQKKYHRQALMGAQIWQAMDSVDKAEVWPQGKLHLEQSVEQELVVSFVAYFARLEGSSEAVVVASLWWSESFEVMVLVGQRV